MITFSFNAINSLNKFTLAFVKMIQPFLILTS